MDNRTIGPFDRMTRFGIVALGVCVFFGIIAGCSDPMSEEDKKALVKTVVDGYLPPGEYQVFWDGTNKDRQQVSAGTYWARLTSRNFTLQITMTALEGGRQGVSNDSSWFSPGDQPADQLLQNHPNPFAIREGTNIPFTLRDSATVQLIVRNKP